MEDWPMRTSGPAADDENDGGLPEPSSAVDTATFEPADWSTAQQIGYGKSPSDPSELLPVPIASGEVLSEDDLEAALSRISTEPTASPVDSQRQASALRDVPGVVTDQAISELVDTAMAPSTTAPLPSHPGSDLAFPLLTDPVQPQSRASRVEIRSIRDLSRVAEAISPPLNRASPSWLESPSPASLIDIPAATLIATNPAAATEVVSVADPAPARREPGLGWLHTARAEAPPSNTELQWPVAAPVLPVGSLFVRGRTAAIRLARTLVVSLTIDVLIMALLSRLFLAGLSWFSLRVLPRLDRYPGQLPDTIFRTHPSLDGWARWDAAHYVAIATLGHATRNPSPGDGAGFFPLYPLVMRTIVDLLGVEPTRQSLAIAGLVVANVCFLFAAVLLAHLTTAQIGPQAGRNAALLFCVSPFSFFFNAGYSESLFVMLVLASLYLADRERWGWAAIAAGLASGTRLAGLALLPALLLQGRRARAPITAFGVIGLLAPSGSLLYFVYSAFVFGDPLAYFKAQAQWGGWNEHVWYYVTLFLRHPSEAIGGDPRHLIILLNLGLAVAALVLLRRLWSSSSVAVALFTTLIVVAHTAISWVSLGRYLLSAVGLYMVAGELLTHPRLAGRPRDLLLIGSTLLLAMLTLLFAHGFWIV